MRTVVDLLALDYTLVSAHGMRAHKVICDVLIRNKHNDCLDSRMFYTPCQWAVKENELVTDCGELVVLCDGGLAGFYFSPRYGQSKHLNAMSTALDKIGLYIDYKSWYAIVRMQQTK